MPTPRRCRLLLLCFAVALAPMPSAAQTPLTRESVAAIAEHAARTFAPKGLSIAVVQDGELLAAVAHGERSDGQPMTTGTLCNIASCTKAFTAAAIALLVDEKKLDWDDLVVQHVPEFRLRDPWITANMTVRDLLCHRSGMVTFAGDLLWYGSDYGDTEVLARMAKLPIPLRFREQYGYQNLMFLVAGLVVQRVSGQSWEDFVAQRLLQPLGMRHSRAAAQLLPADAERALPHIDGVAVPDHEFVACRPAASIYSSADELTAWIRMLLDVGRVDGKNLLSAEALRQMWRPHTITGAAGAGAGTADFASYGLGWFLSLERGQKVVEHDGGMPGFLSKLSLMPIERFGFVVLNNANDGVLNEAVKRAFYAARAGGDPIAQIDRLARVGQRIRQRDEHERKAREGQRREGTKPSRALADYAGGYVDEVYGTADVTLAGDALSIALVPSRARLSGSLSHWHDDTFRVDFPDRFLPFALVRFELDHTGTVTGFCIDCPIADFDFAALAFRRQ
jgi:CubicO group peptidase (beta-lactamase class C family)